MSPTDRELVQSTLEGHLEAYDELMRRHQRLVYGISYRYAKSREGALDLTQVVFLKVFRRLDSFRGKSRFKTWLVRIASNEGVSWVRANRRHLIGRESLDEAIAVADGRSDQESDLVALEARKRLLGGLSRLGERYKRALELRYFHELSVREVAEVLGCSEGTAKNVLFRGMRRLREQVVRV